MAQSNYLRFAVSALAVCGCWAGGTEPVRAQDAAGLPEEAKPDEIGQIIVTAARRETDLQRTPISVTAFSAQGLVENGVEDLRDLTAITPGLTITGDNQLGTAPVAIRGIGAAGGGIGSDNPVGIYLDGVFLGRPAANVFDLVDIERVEVLRGPQGTLFGRNATGGVIQFVTARPSLDEVVVRGDVQYGNLNNVRGRLMVSTPVSDNIGIKLAASFFSRDGYGNNLFTGTSSVAREAPEELFGETGGSVRGSVLFESGRLSAVLSADYSRFTQNVAFKDVTGGLGGFGGIDNYSVNAGARQERELGGVAANLEYELTDAITLTSITAYRTSTSDEVYDSDATPVETFRVEPFETAEQFSQELRLQSNDASRLTWLVGLYYFLEDSEWDATVGRFGATRLNTTNKTESFAGFIDATYELTDRLSITGGLRYSYETKDFSVAAGSRSNPLPNPATDQGSWDAWTPRAVLDYELTPSVFVYASASRGFKSGGFNLTDIGQFDPEFLWAYEGGIKADLFDRRLRANLSAFHYDYSDLQVRIPVRDGQVKTLNAATARVQGIELEFTAIPVPNLTLAGSAAYLSGKYQEYREEFFDTVPGSPTEGEIIRVVDYAGNRLNRAPEWKFNVSADYAFDLGNSRELRLRAEYTHETEMFFTAANVRDFGRGPTDIVNLRAIWDMSDSWRLTAFVENLGNERFVANAVPISGLPKGYASLPRLYGLQLAVRY